MICSTVDETALVERYSLSTKNFFSTDMFVSGTHGAIVRSK
jgi:hypothetical protein